MSNFVIISLIIVFSTLSGLGANVSIIESQSNGLSQNMDDKWYEVAVSMGHSVTIVPQTFLDNTNFFPTTDLLIVASAPISLTPNRVETVLEFIKSGKPVYLQGEYICEFQNNQAFEYIVNSLGGDFAWIDTTSKDMNPMNVLGTYATTYNTVTPLSYFWHGCYGLGCGMQYFLEYEGNYYGYAYKSPNPAYGIIVQTTDEDWIIEGTSPLLMGNIVTHLLNKELFSAFSFNGIYLGNDTILCEGESITLDATTPGASYLWQDNSTNSTFVVSAPGVYWVKVTVLECIRFDTIVVSSFPFSGLGNDTLLCSGDLLVLNAATPGATYQWQDNSTNPTLTVSNPGTYWVTVTVGTCSDTDTIQVTVTPIPNVDLGSDTTICHGDPFLLSSQFPNATYLWQDSSTSYSYSVTQSGSYWLNVTVGNCSNADTIHVTVYTIPGVDLGADTTLRKGDSILLEVNTPNANFIWQDNTTDPTFLVTDPGVYWVYVFEGGCSESDTIIITLNEEDIVCPTYIPNAFTPNADGLNDTFNTVVNCSVTSYSLIIFNRFGEQIFMSTDRTVAWDGSIKGQVAPSGVYVYRLRFTPEGGHEQQYVGHVSLLK